MDKAIEELSGKQWILKSLEKPFVGHLDSSRPISVADFVAEACRQCSKAVKSMDVLHPSMWKPCRPSSKL